MQLYQSVIISDKCIRRLTLRLRGHIPLLIDVGDIIRGVHNNRTIKGREHCHGAAKRMNIQLLQDVTAKRVNEMKLAYIIYWIINETHAT